MDNKILVAGGTGDLGNRIIKALLKRNANVIAIVRKTVMKQRLHSLSIWE